MKRTDTARVYNDQLDISGIIQISCCMSESDSNKIHTHIVRLESNSSRQSKVVVVVLISTTHTCGNFKLNTEIIYLLRPHISSAYIDTIIAT